MTTGFAIVVPFFVSISLRRAHDDDRRRGRRRACRISLRVGDAGERTRGRDDGDLVELPEGHGVWWARGRVVVLLAVRAGKQHAAPPSRRGQIRGMSEPGKSLWALVCAAYVTPGTQGHFSESADLRLVSRDNRIVIIAQHWRAPSLALSFVGMLAAGCSKTPAPPTQQQAPPPPQVGVVAVTPATIAEPYEFGAQVQPFRRVEVRSRVEGIIVERPFTEGSVVSKGPGALQASIR